MGISVEIIDLTHGVAFVVDPPSWREQHVPLFEGLQSLAIQVTHVHRLLVGSRATWGLEI